MMDLLQELLLTALFSLLLALLIAKLVSGSASGGGVCHMRHKSVAGVASTSSGAGGEYLLAEEIVVGGDCGDDGGWDGGDDEAREGMMVGLGGGEGCDQVEEREIELMEEVLKEEGGLLEASGVEKEGDISRGSSEGEEVRDVDASMIGDSKWSGMGEIVQVEIVRSFSEGVVEVGHVEKSEFGKVQMGLVGDKRRLDGDGTSESNVMSHLDERKVEEVKLGSGIEVEKLREQGFVSDVVEEGLGGHGIMGLKDIPICKNVLMVEEVKLGNVGMPEIEEQGSVSYETKMGASGCGIMGLNETPVIEGERTVDEFKLECGIGVVKIEEQGSIGDVIGELNVALPREVEKKMNEITSDSGIGEEKIEEQGFIGDAVEELNVSLSHAVETKMKDITTVGEIGGKRMEDKEGSLFNEDDEWEGIERSVMGKLFGVANAYVCSASGREALSKLSRELQMQLYGLHKVATEGPCYEMQPLALKVSARAKWHAWQKLGSMNPEVAMEKYIALLDSNIPEWMEVQFRGEGKKEEGGDSLGGVNESGFPNRTLLQHDQLSPQGERKEAFS